MKYEWFNYAKPKGRVWALLFYNNHYDVAQWEPKFNCWAFPSGGEVTQTEDVYWRPLPLPPTAKTPFMDKIYALEGNPEYE